MRLLVDNSCALFVGRSSLNQTCAMFGLFRYRLIAVAFCSSCRLHMCFILLDGSLSCCCNA